MRTPTALLSAVLVTAALVIGSAPMAQADTWRHRDAAGDLLVDRYDGNPKVEPNVRNGDLTNMTVRYDEDLLTVAVSVPQLRLANGDSWSARVVTSSGDALDLTYFAADAHIDVQVSRNGEPSKCRGTKVGRTRAGLLVRLPQSCLGRSYRVRVGVQIRATPDGSVEGPRVYDDAYRTGRYTSNRIKLGPWVNRG